MRLPFTKMQGLGNDFMVLNRIENDVQLSGDQILRLSDRHFGIGFDQLLQIEAPSSDKVDFDYRIFNADGQEVEHCGNGARCFARYVREKGLSDKDTIRVKTVNNVLELTIEADGEVSVDMGRPKFDPADIPLKADAIAETYQRVLAVGDGEMTVEFAALSLGNPHAVILVDDVDSAPVAQIGTALGAHPDFTEGANVGFLEIKNRTNSRLRVFERGVGETLACGTGACAAVVAGQVRGLLDSTVRISLLGGELTVSRQDEDSPIIMTGAAHTVFEGSIEI